jgi:hypothetical protein
MRTFLIWWAFIGPSIGLVFGLFWAGAHDRREDLDEPEEHGV